MTNKPKYLLIKPTDRRNEYPYLIIYPDYINIKEIYQSIKSKYGIEYLPNGRSMISAFCNKDISDYRDFLFTDSKIYNKLNGLDSNIFSIGGDLDNAIEDDSLCPTLSQTGNCVILAPTQIRNNVKIRDNAIVGCQGQYCGNVIIKDNAVVLNTYLQCPSYCPSEYDNVIIQDNSVILNSLLHFTSDPLCTINIRDHSYLNNVGIRQYTSYNSKRPSLILSGYTYLYNINLGSSIDSGLIHNTIIIANDALTFDIKLNSPCNLIGITIDMRDIPLEEQLAFFEKNDLDLYGDQSMNNIVIIDEYECAVLLDDFINEFAA